MKRPGIDPGIEYVYLPARERGQGATKSCKTATSQQDSVMRMDVVDLTSRHGCIQRSIT